MIATTAALALAFTLVVQDYVPPQDPAVRAKLAAWQDLKFGLLMHWGVYSQRGIVESWTLCSEDQPWCDRDGANYVDYVREYERLIETFDPRGFDPAPWAATARAAGMKYVVFTTKHHDGFAMFDTQLSDYSIASERCPFHTSPKADVTKAIFEAFRAADFWTGVYFSKPDWHHDDYWAPEWATPNRCNNYDTGKYPERWQRFRDFTFGQLEELMTGYGPIDILWLDGGWVRPDDTITDEVRAWGYDIPSWEQDIDMPRIATMARAHQPGLLIVDRTVHGPYENYRTPEQRVPDEALPYPWETCLTLSQSWSWVAEPEFKSTRELVHTLVDVVAKGGNLLLNVAPSTEGRWDEGASERLAEIGTWLDLNGSALYGTRPIAPYVSDDVRYTRAKDGGPVYVIRLAADGETEPPAEINFSGLRARSGSAIRCLETGDALPWIRAGETTSAALLPELRARLKSRHAWTLVLDEPDLP